MQRDQRSPRRGDLVILKETGEVYGYLDRIAENGSVKVRDRDYFPGEPTWAWVGFCHLDEVEIVELPGSSL